MIARWRAAFRFVYLAARFGGKPIKIHSSAWVSRRSVIRIVGGGSVTIGANCEIHDFAMILTYGGHIKIGANSSLNPFAIVYGHGGTDIGAGVRIAAHTVIIPANHVREDGQIPIHLSRVSAKGIKIEDDVWIGSGCRILDGVTIGRHTTIAAGSVVTRSVPESVTAAGVPARVIKTGGAEAV
jgi:acetyltransferase-like isoleucine patch superfamily enzyme